MSNERTIKIIVGLMACVAFIVGYVVIVVDQPQPAAEADVEQVTAVKKVAASIGSDGGWIEDLALSEKLAADLNRPILMNFTGSDWCPGCIMLDREVFKTEEFRRYAAESLVLLKVDFPKRRQQPLHIQRQNLALDAKYFVGGAVPTLVVVGQDGRAMG